MTARQIASSTWIQPTGPYTPYAPKPLTPAQPWINPWLPTTGGNQITGGSTIQFIQGARPTLKCQCGKACQYTKIATETKPAKAAGKTARIVVKEREAVYCDGCGVIAWLS